MPKCVNKFKNAKFAVASPANKEIIEIWDILCNVIVSILLTYLSVV